LTLKNNNGFNKKLMTQPVAKHVTALKSKEVKRLLRYFTPTRTLPANYYFDYWPQ
jgi:hypothetical protein